LNDYLRILKDFNNDGKADIIGFGAVGVHVAQASNQKFDVMQDSGTAVVIDHFGTEAGWTTRRHQRVVADIDNDGLLDIVGFGDVGVIVSYGSASGMEAPIDVGPNYYKFEGWASEAGYYIRKVIDVNNDQLLDFVFITDVDVRVSLNQGRGSAFGPEQIWSTEFGNTDAIGGLSWKQLTAFSLANNRFENRFLADVSGDGLPDLIGIHRGGVYVALNTGSSFAQQSHWSTSFDIDDPQWGALAPYHGRALSDINSDGLQDLLYVNHSGHWLRCSDDIIF